MEANQGGWCGFWKVTAAVECFREGRPSWWSLLFVMVCVGATKAPTGMVKSNNDRASDFVILEKNCNSFLTLTAD